MDERLQGVNQIYAVIGPERNAVERECNVARPTGASI